MKKTNQVVLAAGVFAVATVLGLSSIQGAKAYRGDGAAKGPNYSEERHEAMERAFEKKDYNAWKALMQGRGRVTSIITEQNFSRFAEAHELSEQGKYTEADAIRKELGLRTREGMQSRGAFGMGQGVHSQNRNR